MWRPSRRTSLTARVGRRYGDTIYTGSFAYRADHATSIQVGVYDGLSSLGRGLSGGLAALPTQFDPTRNPIGGNINPCVFGLIRSEEHTSELQSLMRISYAVFCLKKKKKQLRHSQTTHRNKS